MSEFDLHPSFRQDAAETNLPNGLNVVFPQQLSGKPPIEVGCFTAEQLTISLVEKPDGQKFVILAMRYGPTGLVMDYNSIEHVDSVIEGLQRARELMK